MAVGAAVVEADHSITRKLNPALLLAGIIISCFGLSKEGEYVFHAANRTQKEVVIIVR